MASVSAICLSITTSAGSFPRNFRTMPSKFRLSGLVRALLPLNPHVGEQLDSDGYCGSYNGAS